MNTKENRFRQASDPNAQTSSIPVETVSLLSALPAGVCLVRNHIIHWANLPFYEMVGQRSPCLEGQNGALLFHASKEFHRVSRSLADDVAATGQGMVETRLLRAGRTAFDCRIRASRMSQGGYFVLVITDITQIKSRQIRNQQAQKMEAIGVLAGGISHDFNNILMGVQGYLSLMRINMESPEELACHIKGVSRLVDTAADLTARLLGFARGGKYQISVLDINEVAAMALNIFKPAHKEIQIHQVFAPSPLPVAGDHSQLEQVILNLLVNGAQAMSESGTITVVTLRENVGKDHGYHFEVKPGPYVRIEIRDTGLGMDEETRERVFEPFFSTKAVGNHKGRGLGLSTVFGIVKNHGGFITVESTPGRGSTFCVFLPCSAKAPAGDAEETRQFLNKMPMGSETILLVDDEEDILFLGRQFLGKLGYRTMLARNGREAVDLFRRHTGEISLVVLDLIMPVMGGKEALFEIQQIRSDVKVLVSTGYNVDEDVESLLKLGCHGFLQKPFSMRTFSATIRAVLDGVCDPNG